MTGVQTPLATKLPSFSIILETENLANADIQGLVKSLASLVNQDISPAQANEVLLIESGDTPPELLQQLCQMYPWIQVCQAPLSTGYYKAKMLGAQQATGDIIVYCDSDCIYEPHWLRTILTTFADHPDIQIVAGETTTRGVGPYGTAMALTYIFPQYTQDRELAPTHQYFLNNVAFRRQFLLTCPIPAELPLYRGNCVIHAYDLSRQGYTIWRQPQARATHAPPNGLSHFFWRFLMIGYDMYWQKQVFDQKAIESAKVAISQHSQDMTRKLTLAGFQSKSGVFFQRMGRMFRNNPWHLLYFPLALPIAAVSVALIYAGYLITTIQPDFLLKTYDQVLGEA